MTGFSPDWLALREPADHRARNPGLAGELVRHFDSREAITIVDLGCGTGSNLRAMASLLPTQQSWTLVDYDPTLLAAAREKLVAWADRASDTPDGGLALDFGQRKLKVRFLQADLNRDLEQVLSPATDLVTAAALFDLVSESWIEGFAATLVAKKLPLYTVLTYDGTEQWEPPLALDQPILAAFHAHQSIDKGFGHAAGPRATLALRAAFEKHGYSVTTADSPWRLEVTSDAALMLELSRGTARAAAETKTVSGDDAETWAAMRTSAIAAMIGHSDLLALP